MAVEFRCRSCRSLLTTKTTAELVGSVIVPPCPKHSGRVTLQQMMRIRRSGRPTALILHHVVDASQVHREIAGVRGTPVMLV